MPIYPKTYEDVYSSNRSRKNLNITRVNSDGMDLVPYNKLLKDVFFVGMNSMFNFYVQVIWLKRKFGYLNRSRKKGARGIIVDRAYSIFLRDFAGRDFRVLTRDFAFSKVETYIDEMFPYFDDNNPFTNPELFQFPFKKISIDFLTVVYQLTDRMEILEFADKSNMGYNEFLDFVINHISTINQNLKKDRYDFMLTNTCPPYVRDNEKK